MMMMMMIPLVVDYYWIDGIIIWHSMKEVVATKNNFPKQNNPPSHVCVWGCQIEGLPQDIFTLTYVFATVYGILTLHWPSIRPLQVLSSIPIEYR
jgi:hypothetical protein